jgi:hypothetical protein
MLAFVLQPDNHRTHEYMHTNANRTKKINTPALNTRTMLEGGGGADTHQHTSIEYKHDTGGGGGADTQQHTRIEYTHDTPGGRCTNDI